MNGPKRARISTRHRLGAIIAAFLFFTSLPSVRGADYVVIVDASVSMDWPVDKGRDSRRRLNVLREALNSFLKDVPLESRVYLAAFNSTIIPQAELVVRSDADRATLQRAVADLDRLVANRDLSGATHLWSALDHALLKGSEYSAERPDRTVLVRVLTDGEDNDPRYKGMTAQAAVDRLRNKYPAMREVVSLVLLGSMDFKLRGMDVIKAPDFTPSFPPSITWSPSSPRAGQTVTIADASTQKFDAYDWWVDGKLTSRQKSFTMQFTTAGAHTVQLLAVARNGSKEKAAVTISVMEEEKPEPMAPTFTFVPPAPEPRQIVRFYGRAAGKPAVASWSVNGEPSGTGYELQTQFGQIGDYDVTFTVRDAAGREENYSERVKVREKPLTVMFSAPTEAVSGTELSFQNLTVGNAAQWKWEFGDGASSSGSNATHAYLNRSDQPMRFNVTLTAQSLFGSNYQSEPKTVLIYPQPKPPKAAFHVKQAEIKVGQIVNFSDESTGATAWRWDFSGEETSQLQHPEFTFQTSGLKTIQLTVTGPGGSDGAISNLTVLPRDVPVRIAMVSSNGASTLPPVLDLGMNNPVHLKTGTVLGTAQDTLEITFAAMPQGSNGVVVHLKQPTNAFELQLRKGGDLLPFANGTRLQSNAIIRVALDTNAPEATHKAELRFEPIGQEVLLNGATNALSLKLAAQIGTGGGGEWLVIVLLALFVLAAAAVWIFRPRPMDSQSSVIVYVSETRERPTGNSARPLAYGGVSQRFPLKTNEMVVLGPSFDSPYIFDIALPDWRIRREAKRITLLNQRDPKQIKVLKAPGLQIEEIKNGEGKPRRLSIHVEVGKPARLQKGKTAAQRRSK